MVQFIYDGTFAGLLTTIFEVYEKKYADVSIVKSAKVEALVFSENTEIITDDEKSQRVWRGLKKKLSEGTLKNMYWCFLSEIKGIETTILNFTRYVFSTSENIEDNYGNANVLDIAQTARKVGREKHRFEAFVRFELIGTDLFYAPIDPDFNVLPLIIPHFKRRYPAMDWIIYDTKRKYGIHYDQASEKINEVVIDFTQNETLVPGTIIFDPDEQKYKDLWKNYFKSVNIPARKNMKLHLKHIPKRYWKYLVEKR